MSVGAAEMALDDLAFRVIESAEANAWMVAVSDQSSAPASLRAEIDQLRNPDESPAMLVAVNRADDLFKAVHHHPRGIVIATGAAQLSADDWRSLDANRSRLQREGTTVLVLNQAGAALLENVAPNLASWVGGRVWRLADGAHAPALSPNEIEERLAALRAWAGRDDAEVIRLAETGELPRDPEYAEWVALLGRGDLLVS